MSTLLFFYKSLKKKYLFFFILFWGNNICSQNLEKVYITVLPHNTVIELDEYIVPLTKENQPFELELEPGSYPIRLWAPGYKIINDTLVISRNIKNKYAKFLSERTQDFKEFKKSNHVYKRQIRSKKAKKTALVTICTLLSLYAIDGKRFEIIKYKKEANEAYRNYNSSTTLINFDLEYDNYINAKTKYDKVVNSAKKRLKFGIPIAAVISLGTWLQIRKINKKKLPAKPIFQAKYPFNKPHYKIGFTPFGRTNEVGIRITF